MWYASVCFLARFDDFEKTDLNLNETASSERNILILLLERSPQRSHNRDRIHDPITLEHPLHQQHQVSTALKLLADLEREVHLYTQCQLYADRNQDDQCKHMRTQLQPGSHKTA
jgi:hypothetical protein